MADKPTAKNQRSEGGDEPLPNASDSPTQKLESPLKPLLWVLIPLLLIIIYAALSN